MKIPTETVWIERFGRPVECLLFYASNGRNGREWKAIDEHGETVAQYSTRDGDMDMPYYFYASKKEGIQAAMKYVQERFDEYREQLEALSFALADLTT